MTNMRCRKTRGCRALNGHTGTCYNRKGNPIPKNRPVIGLKVVSRDKEGKPRFRRHYI